MIKNLILVGLFLSFTLGKVYFKDSFDGDWESRWIKSKNPNVDLGNWELNAGKFARDSQDKGIQTTPDSKHFQISTKFPEFSNRDKDLYLQYSVKHEQKIDCGGGYVKLMGEFDQEKFSGDTPYNIMFGPDICGSTKRVHFILSYKGNNYLLKKDVRCETDTFTHVYTMALHPNNTFHIYIDGALKHEGSLYDEWDILAPREIQDPDAKKPIDWVDQKMIPDPNDVKPEGWDDIPRKIKDENAKKPEDWSDEVDGVWEAPMINNPDYSGDWKPKMIENPGFKGPWVHPMIPNPNFVSIPDLYVYDHNSAIGFEIWQVKAGTIFDNIIISDDWNDLQELIEIGNANREFEKELDKEEKDLKRKENEEKRKIEREEKEREKKNKHDHDHDEDDEDIDWIPEIEDMHRPDFTTGDDVKDEL